MLNRILAPPHHSFFLLGPRQTGKSTWIRSLQIEPSWMINLLKSDQFFKYVRDPSQFRREAKEKIHSGCEWIIIDEVQRIPELLNEVHLLMEEYDCNFILSGSSARKLKQKGANMLGGRALKRYMHPFTVSELSQDSPPSLDDLLIWGTLPAIWKYSRRDARDHLKSYVEVYLREEILQEALVRNIGGYTRFLDLVAAYCGEIVHFTSVGKEAGIPTRTVQSYFEILEDTLLAIRLPAWRKSPTKSFLSHPKTYLFDNGITNSLCHRLGSGEIDAKVRGRLFEQFMIQETRRILDYRNLDFALYYWRTNHGAEVDLLIESDGQLIHAIEFKSGRRVSTSDISGLRSFHEDYPQVSCTIVSTMEEPFTLDFVSVIPWRMYLDLLQNLPS